MAIDINIPSQVKNYANLAGFPATGTLKTIFIAEDTNKTYRWTGSAYVEISPAGASGVTIGTTAITSGTVGRVLFEGTGNVVQESANLFWDNTNGRLGVGTSTPNSALEVVDTGGASFVAAARFLVPNNNVAGRVSQFYLGQAMTSLNSISWSFHYQGNGSTANYQSFGFNGIATPALTMFGTLNVGINTTTDAGYKLDVNGTARVNTLTIGLGTGQIATNVVVGYQGLFSNTTGLQNIAIGYQAVYTNTTGSGNVGIGASSLVFNSTGSGNTAFGDESLLRNTTGARNIGVGQRAGTYAGSGTANNQTSSDSIYIGYQARASASGATNELVFGKDTVGGGSNSVVLGNDSITTTLLKGNVGIGTSSPAQKLDVNGNTQITGNLIFPAGERLIQYGASSFFAGRDAAGVYLAYGFGSQQIDIGSISTGNIRLRTTANVILDNGSSKLLIGTSTDAGYKLDVNGTARVTGNITQSGANTSNLGYIVNTGVLGSASNLPSASILGMVIGCVSNNGHTATFTKGDNANSTAIRITDQNVGLSVNHFIVDYRGASGFGIANGTLQVNASAQVEIQSTTKGFLPPRMTTTQKNAIASPATGLQIYDSTLNRPCFYDGTSWITL